ncbi:putative ribonucleoside diphosphate reductase large subunit [Diachasmimorpha longicaudata entomopoxvirus]|uniref:Ribonucleotide reductase large subunit n=1 Tax=Diachasmimorpha longicaudata entomopoxvirus TaxID=109981 RepID=A0A7R5WLX1_9POXV|nr:putative ribonucleoside diphosphate reductase large subunit [Diachasmimorpha longicaudata entomopoxvirus]AKS26319.1 putative ribonucleoside diphosphate reductase large subunit [Diachasmimorpha longicaudata entomopoxvirus]
MFVFEEYFKNLRKHQYQGLCRSHQFYQTHPNGETYPVANQVKNFSSVFIDRHGIVSKPKEALEALFKILGYINTQAPKEENIPNFSEYFKYLSIISNEPKFFTNFFEEITTLCLSHIIKSPHFDTIGKNIQLIYYYITSFDSFSIYLMYFADIFQVEHARKILPNLTLDVEYDFFHTNFTGRGLQLLSMGGLSAISMIDSKGQTRKIIVENLPLMYTRIVCQLGSPVSSQIVSPVTLYNNLWDQHIIPSTPVFYNALHRDNNLLTSCFILDTTDEIDSIGNLFKEIIQIKRFGSGIGVNFSKLRARGAQVRMAEKSNGLGNYIKAISGLSEQFKNEEKERASPTNINISIDHPDLLELLALKESTFIDANYKMNNIFLTVSIPDEFMYRYIQNQPWFLISPEQGNLPNLYGKAYSDEYNRLVKDPNVIKTEISSSVLMNKITDIMLKTGGPFLFFKDVINETSNQKNIGTISATNLCTEILEYTDNKETACCNITSLNLKSFIKNGIFDINLFRESVGMSVICLANTLEYGATPSERCQLSNQRRKPIGIGIQGLADMFMALQIPFLEGKRLYRYIIEELYCVALTTSCSLVKNFGFKPWFGCESSPLQKDGLFSFDLYRTYQAEKRNKLLELNFENLAREIKLSEYSPMFIAPDRWSRLKRDIQTYGCYNSLLVALMPTALTASIHNNVDTSECMFKNLYISKHSRYEHFRINPYMIQQLKNINPFKIVDTLQRQENCIKQELFKTIYDLDELEYTNFQAYANPFIDQGRSYNLYIKDNNKTRLLQVILLNWLKGTKTIYYYKTHIAINALNLKEDSSDSCQMCSS